MTRKSHHWTRSWTIKILAAAFLVLAPAYLAGAGRGAENNKETNKQQKIEALFPEAAAEAEANTPPSGYASLYVLRPSGIVGMAVDWCLDIDSQQWGGLGAGQFSWDPLSPGDHNLARTFKSVALHAEPGKTYYAALNAGTVKFLTPEDGEKMRKKLSLNPTRWLARQYFANWLSVQIGMKAEDVERLIRMSDGQAYIERPEGSRGVFKGIAYVRDEPAGVPTDASLFRFNSAAIGYQLTFTYGVLTGKADAAPFSGTLGMTACVPPMWR